MIALSLKMITSELRIVTTCRVRITHERQRKPLYYNPRALLPELPTFVPYCVSTFSSLGLQDVMSDLIIHQYSRCQPSLNCATDSAPGGMGLQA